MNEGFTPAQLNNRDIDRLKSYKELLEFYHGQHWEGYARRGEKRLTFNYAKVVIDKITSYLMTGITFTVEPAQDSDEVRVRAQRAEQALYQVYEDNNLEQLDFETEIDCAILGDACLKVIWDAETKSVKITAPDIQGIYAWWVGDDTSRVWRVASKYSLTSDEAEILYKVKPKGKTAHIVELWTAQEFELWLDNALVEKKPNPYGFIPFIIYPNLREPKKFWGISDVYQLIQPQRELNRIQVEGYDPVSDEPVIVNCFDWDEIDRLYDRLRQVEDRNLDTVAKAEDQGNAYLREAEIKSGGGVITIPVNCGQQLYDVIDITDSRAGLDAEKRRGMGIILIFNPSRAQYEQRLTLGAV